VIQSFADRMTRDLWNGLVNARTRRFPQALLPIAHRKLDMMNAAADLKDLRSPPGNRLEELKGDLRGHHSIRVNEQWRIVFRWTAAGPADVRILDYH
jgi:proteic killer suppression protein